MDVALVGIGKIAWDEHVPVIHASPDWTLAACVSRSGRIDGVPHYTDFDRFLEERPEVRVVSLCMPPVPRFAYAAAAIRSGRHVMLEKPPGASMAECLTLAAMAKERRVTLYATWHSRQAAMVASAKDWLVDKTLHRLDITWKEDVRLWHPGQAWLWEPGGMGVFDPGINALSIATEILPGKMHLTDALIEVPENRQAPIAAELGFRYPDNAEVRASFDWRQTGAQTWQIRAETDGGTLLLDTGGSEMSVDGVAFGQKSEEPTLRHEYTRLYARMADLIARGESDADFEPLMHVADAFLLGRRRTVAAFHD